MSSALVTDQPCFTLIGNNNSNEIEPFNEQSLKDDLETGNDQLKIVTLKRIIQLMLSGEKLNNLLMTVIRFVLPTQNHTLKKLLFLYFEIIPKTNSDGKLRHEMILVCDAYRKDLLHSNEFIRGSTLRFLCKLKEPELLEPLMPSIRSCLEYKHAYVKRNAVLAVYTIYQHCESLIPDAPDLVLKFLENEGDPSCKRNAFLMLLHVDQKKALDYLATYQGQVSSFGDTMQLVVVELIYKVCHRNPSERGRFLRCVYTLLSSSSPAVRYEAAGTLATLSNTPTAIKSVGECYIDLIITESDNNVKLIVLDRLANLCARVSNRRILQNIVMDLLRTLEAPDIEVRRKTLDLVFILITIKTANEVAVYLRRELNRANEHSQEEDVKKYKQLIIKCLHITCTKFPDVAPTLLPSLVNSTLDDNEDIACDVLKLVREMAQLHPMLRSNTIKKLIDLFSQVKLSEVLRSLLWILGEYCSTEEEIARVLQEIRMLLGELPIVESEQRKHNNNNNEDDALSMDYNTSSSSYTYVTADGTYATQSALNINTNTYTKKPEDNLIIRQHLLDGNFVLACSLSTALTKLCVCYRTICTNQQNINAITGESMLIIASILRLGKSKLIKKSVSAIEFEQLWLCISLLSEHDPMVGINIRKKSSEAANALLNEKLNQIKINENNITEDNINEANDAINFGLLAPTDSITAENRFEASLQQAVGAGDNKGDTSNESNLDRVYQMTGFSDPIYAEAFIYVHQFDIILDLLIVNQTSDTLQSILLELATHGDLKLVEKPCSINLGPHDFANIKATVKVSSTENGVIFGNIVYDIAGTASSDKNCVVLNDIHIDIMDYIKPCDIVYNDFRKKWIEFEWENKLTVNTNVRDMRSYLDYLLKSTNMKCLTPDKALLGDCDFLCANLYAKSIFGEEALANISLRKPQGEDTSVSGHIRIRAKSQGMALSLGDKINIIQKKDITNR